MFHQAGSHYTNRRTEFTWNESLKCLAHSWELQQVDLWLLNTFLFYEPSHTHRACCWWLQLKAFQFNSEEAVLTQFYRDRKHAASPGLVLAPLLAGFSFLLLRSSAATFWTYILTGINSAGSKTDQIYWPSDRWGRNYANVANSLCVVTFTFNVRPHSASSDMLTEMSAGSEDILDPPSKVNVWPPLCLQVNLSVSCDPSHDPPLSYILSSDLVWNLHMCKICLVFHTSYFSNQETASLKRFEPADHVTTHWCVLH